VEVEQVEQIKVGVVQLEVIDLLDVLHQVLQEVLQFP
jgi:hypothetical protein